MSKRLLAHCGLPWEDGVLDFHATQRTVQTASLGQARPLQPAHCVYCIVAVRCLAAHHLRPW